SSLTAKQDKRALARGVVVGSVLAVGILAGCTVSSGAAGQGQLRSSGKGTIAAAGTVGPAVAVAVQQEFVSVIRRVLPSVVEIRTNEGLGSGVVLDSDGDIVTNAHVVAGASSFQVLPVQAAGSTAEQPAVPAAPVPAVLVGSCPGEDLAVIRVSADVGLHPATFGDLKSVAVGDLVLAIGSPLGLGGSVTEGIVSAVGRSVAEPASIGAPAAVLADVIQTSAAINPGNSGGALVGIDGTVIGIPTLAAVNHGGAAPGIGFAISASEAVSIGRQLAGTGGVNPGTAPSGCHS
ncbi:MAG TPA: trypsin-like peptidase domain-containing protein, partial [Trebonia sp.]